MVPWLLLVIAGLIVACAVMHSRLRETESATRGQQSVIADELRDAEATLVSALDRLRRMDQELSERESGIAQRLRESGDRFHVDRAPVAAPGASWRREAVELWRRGMSALEIARELELPVGEVELVLALECPGTTYGGISLRSPDPGTGTGPRHRAGRPTRPSGPA